MVYTNLIKLIIDFGGKINPILIPSNITNGTGLCNPSIFFHDNKLKMILRHVEYTLFCSEGTQKFKSKFEGPVSYYHPDNDLNLRTNNYYCEIDVNTLEVLRHNKIDTTKLDVKPIWHFIGLEDARLVYWNNRYYGCGVRRDTTTNGTGRIELSELEINDNSVTEIKRSRIEVDDTSSYCEKNWMPIIDKPFHFIKWCNPVEVVKVNLDTNSSKRVFISKNPEIAIPGGDLRGGSNLIPWEDGYISIVHICEFVPKNINGYKDSDYYHKFVIWNSDFTINKITDTFNFMTGKIEFCIGLELINNHIYIAFSFHDNGSYIVKIQNDAFKKILSKLLPPN